MDFLETLFLDTPPKTVYHYASLSAMMGIIENKCIWATDIRYLNDLKELVGIIDLLNSVINKNWAKYSLFDTAMFRQFKDWLKLRVGDGNMIFTCSFSENGNLLSQWRSYCPPDKGVSIGFNTSALKDLSKVQKYCFGKCIYDRYNQLEIIKKIIKYVQELCSKRSEEKKIMANKPQGFYPAFNEIENELLMIASLFKDPSFEEENEWRLISETKTNYVKTPIHYREGKTSLIPYLKFNLESKESLYDEIIVGPTPNNNLSMSSIIRYLSKYSHPKCNIIRSSRIPYRVF
ncbi:hypothetical protein DID80_08535 [Candidatus Marinamargulisbacteria bacterium SCGC AAA071-K20]|nr:hypothetical protein DID80_08535 [Candidatus Marinamargulisbacteria bacterium SCGC AAA071-K20]